MYLISSGIMLSLLLVSVQSKFDCPAPVVCDPSLETGEYINSAHFLTDVECQQSCQLGHPYNPCKFFTWVPNAGPGVVNCYQMSACHTMSDPINGARSGAWSCEDKDLFCGAISDIPIFDDKKTVWTCDHDVHPYGDDSVKIFQDTTCYTTCPSFKYQSKSDPIVSSKCTWDKTSGTSVWTPADPVNVVDTNGDLVKAADVTPNPACGCEDYVLQNVKKTQKMLENVASDEANLEAKIDKKRSEMERNQKRLQTLQSVRPAFMDEYEKLEGDLQKQYEVFIERYRNLTYLEQQLEEYSRAEQDRFEETENTLKQMQTRLRQEDDRIKMSDEILGDEDMNGLDVVEDAEESESEEDDDDEDDDAEETNAGQRARGKFRQAPQQKNPRVFGNMGAGLSDDESGSSGDDGDSISVDDDDLLDDQDGDSDDLKVDGPSGKQQDEDSDDDF